MKLAQTTLLPYKNNLAKRLFGYFMSKLPNSVAESKQKSRSVISCWHIVTQWLKPIRPRYFILNVSWQTRTLQVPIEREHVVHIDSCTLSKFTLLEFKDYTKYCRYKARNDLFLCDLLLPGRFQGTLCCKAHYIYIYIYIYIYHHHLHCPNLATLPTSK